MYVCSECGASQPVAGSCGHDGTPLAPIGEDVLLGTTVGAYRIARLLGVGGMGRVYKGVHPSIGSRVAIKVLSRECSDRRDLVERFFAEAKAVNLIRHESIVNVLDLAMLPDGRPYIIMEYLDGAALATLVEHARTQQPMPLGSLARLAVEVLDALGAAHAKGIVHRDLKPDNIFVTPSGRPKVLDFGIAKLSDQAMSAATRTGSLLGTPHYMSPEQASGRPVDHRADLYAMGVILFECATGTKPFAADSLFDLLRKHVEEPAPSPRARRGDLPPGFEQVILTALEKAPERRFGSAAAMSVALQNATASLPPEQWTPISGSGTYRAAPSGGWQSGPLGHVSTANANLAPRSHVSQAVPPPLAMTAAPAPKKGLWIGLGAVALVGGGVAAGIAASGGQPAAPPSAAAAPPGIDTTQLQHDLDQAMKQLESVNLSPAMKRQLQAFQEAQQLPPEQRAAKLRELQQEIAKDFGDAGKALDDIPTGPGPAEATEAAEADERPRATPPPSPPPPSPRPRPAGTWVEDRELGFPLRYQPERADVGALVAWALAEARKTVPDAEVYWIDADNVAPDGTMNMSLPSFASDHGSINLRFRSPSQMTGDPAIPKGVKVKASCEFRIELEPDGAEIRRIDGSACDRSHPVKPPRCTPAQLWKRALAKGAPTGAVANLTYRTTSAGSPGKWYFDVGTAGDKLYSAVFDDGC